MNDAIEVGDHVTIGTGTVHWVVEQVWDRFGRRTASLRSGLTGRRRYELVADLTLHTKGHRA